MRQGIARILPPSCLTLIAVFTVGLASGQTSAPAGAAARPAAPIAVGNQRQLFIDNRFIESSTGVAITMNPPLKRGAVLKTDRPWEAFRLTSYFTVVQDGDVAKMYYSCFSKDQWHTPDAWAEHAFLCYAQSKDGLNWEKPNLGLVDFAGSKQNNIVSKGIVDGTVFIDPSAPADRRYKLLHTMGSHEEGLRISYSADGLRFETPQELVSPWRPDSQQNAFYDERIGKYVAYLRARPTMGLNPPNRSVVRVELDQIDKPWSNAKPHIVFSTDEQDPPDVDFYTNAAVRYPWAQDAYFMFPAAYHHFPKEFGNDGLLDSSAAVSRDGTMWQRPDRRPYVRLGLKGEWDESFIMMGVGLARFGDSLYQYYNGTHLTHGGTREESKIKNRNRTGWGWMAAVEQRLDGFYSADAPYAGGTFTTPAVVFAGDRLVLNIDTSSAGNAYVTILGPDNQPMPGFSLDECDEVMANAVDHTVTWRHKSDVAALAGTPVKLQFRMRSAKLYAFQFSTERPTTRAWTTSNSQSP